MKMKKLIAVGLMAAMFLTAGMVVSSAESKTATMTGDAKNLQTFNGYSGPGGDVVIPEGTTTIGQYFFTWHEQDYPSDPIINVVLPDSVTSIDERAFEKCLSLESVTLGNSVRLLGRCVFVDCSSLKRINIPSSLIKIPQYAFARCTSLPSITLPDSITEIEYHAFDSCKSLSNIKFGNSLIFIRENSFYHCTALTSVVLPNSLTTIEFSAFEGCSELTTITIPESVTFIGEDVFKGCDSLMDIYFTGSKDKWDKLAKNLTLNSYTTVHCATDLKILTQPSNVTTRPGSSVSFTVKAQGDGLKYQWYYMKAGAASWSQWGARTTATTTATANESWEGMRVYCKVTDKYGNTVKSNPVTINLTQDLVITGQPVSITTKPNKLVKFSVKAEGIGLTYQWYYKKSGQSSWNIWREYYTSVIQPPANNTWNGMQVRCLVTDATGKSIYSNTATVTIVPYSASDFQISSQPKSVSISSEDVGKKQISFSVAAKNGSDLKYQWYYCKAGDNSWNVWKGRINPTESVIPNSTWNGIQLYCRITNNDGDTLYSDLAKVTIIDSTLSITTQPVNKTVTLGNSITLSLKAQGVGLSYQWYFKKAGQTSWTAWSGRTHASETVTPNSTWNGIQLYCLVKDSLGKSVKSNTIKVTVNSPLSITTQPVNKTVTLGNSVTLSLKAQGTGLSYQWYFKKVGQASWNAWSGRTHASETVTPNSTWNGIQLYCIVKDSSGNSVKSNTIKVTVNSTLSITTQPVNKTVTLGNSVTLSLKAQGVGLSYQWYFKKAGQTSWAAWSGRTHASETVTPNSTWNGIQLYCLVKDSSGNSVKSNTIKVSILSPSPLITPGEYRCYSFATGRGSFDYDDFKAGNTILLSVYADNTATMYSNLYWDEGDHYDRSETTKYLTYDEDAFYLNGKVFCYYQFNEHNMHLDLWYMDFDSYSFVIEKYY